MIRTSLAVTLLLLSYTVNAQQPPWLAQFAQLHQADLAPFTDCQTNTGQKYTVCSDALRSEGNGPFVLHHGGVTGTTVVLFHGLSDSPFFMKSIAATLHQRGYTVMVGLLPGHGINDADDDMEDSELGSRWQSRVSDTVKLAQQISDRVYIGGFSTGGALATQYALHNPEVVDGLLLFSGALALDESVEDMAAIWGIKWLTKLLDGRYATSGPNPYKYPHVSKYGAFVLMDVILDIRKQIKAGNVLNLAIFSAHSMADKTTPWRGIELLKAANKDKTTTFKIDKALDVCHADVVISESQLQAMQYDVTKVDDPEPCTIPKANPLHGKMLEAMNGFLDTIEQGQQL